MFLLEENLTLSNVLIREESNFDDKYVEKSVQLVRGSSFRNDLLQNPYFNKQFSKFVDAPILTQLLIDICIERTKFS